MATLPQFKTDIRELGQMQTTWATQLNPLIKNPANNSSILQSVSLSAGSNTINHKLGRKLQGWALVRQRGVAASVYDNQDSNQYPDLTLILVSSAPVVVDILVF